MSEVKSFHSKREEWRMESISLCFVGEFAFHTRNFDSGEGGAL